MGRGQGNNQQAVSSLRALDLDHSAAFASVLSSAAPRKTQDVIYLSELTDNVSTNAGQKVFWEALVGAQAEKMAVIDLSGVAQEPYLVSHSYIAHLRSARNEGHPVCALAGLSGETFISVYNLADADNTLDLLRASCAD
jgi:transcriptional regulator GlxA family with amidase domain